MIKVNLGCANITPEDWVNVDYSIGARVRSIPILGRIIAQTFFSMDRPNNIHIHDIRKRLPWEDSSVDVIYSSHTLEHLSREDGASLILECHRVLRPGGVIRIVVPDLQAMTKNYLQNGIDSRYFLEYLGVDLGAPRGASFIKKIFYPFVNFPHLCMYDNDTLVESLSSGGFFASTARPMKSSIPSIGNIERLGRTENAAIAEGIKGPYLSTT